MNASISQLKAHLGRYMKAVKRGVRVTITDRGEAVATLGPLKAERKAPALELVRERDPGAPRLSEVLVKAVRVPGLDSVALLAQDRARR